LISLIYKVPPINTGPVVERAEPCRICGCRSGFRVATVDYWDIRTSEIILCPECKLAQLDPMLTNEETSEGCLAYYIEESLRVSRDEQFRNCVRNFRRGVLFAYTLQRRKISPNEVLELGPGSGYFSAGLKFVFPWIRITVMDVNPSVLEFIRNQHGYEVIRSVPDSFSKPCEERFDLVIARDILEHVADISAVLSNIRRYLTPGGYFHFITPNGPEDVWKHYITCKLTHSPSELLINHVNYFDGKGLRDLLEKNGFIPVEYYTYDLKRNIKGGWVSRKMHRSPVSVKRDARKFIGENEGKLSPTVFKKEEILDKWYIRENMKWITFLYSFYQHFPVVRLNPDRNTGHEILGLFRKAIR
jgi:SAM-dependent methyltransferase